MPSPEQSPATPASPTLAGRCLCGAVSYTVHARPVWQFNCHCRDCQRTSGSGFAPLMFVEREHVQVSGQASYFTSAGGSGKPVSRGFCPQCGSNLFADVALVPHLMQIRAGTLDEPERYRPAANVFSSQAQCWAPMDDGIARHDTMPGRR